MTTTETELKALMLASQDGDAAAHRMLLERLSRHLRAYYKGKFAKIGRGVAEAEDLVQEAVLAIHLQRHTYDPQELLTPWVHAIARYKLMDFFRARSRREALNDPLDETLDIFATSDEEPADAKRDIGKLLEQLPDRHRLPIVHVKLQGLSVTETATLTGMSESAIKVGIHRGLKALAAKIRGNA